MEPFEPEEIQRIITAALKHRNGVRYVVALALGCRQGETLAFKWDRLDRTARVIRVKKGLQRQTWRHGCNDPHACGANRHRKKCPEPCDRHRNPKNCVRDVKGHPRPCPPELPQPRQQVPTEARRRTGRSRREVESWAPLVCPPLRAVRPDHPARTGAATRAGARRYGVDRRRVDVLPANRQANRPPPRLGRVKGTSGRSRCSRGSSTRCTSHDGNGAAPSWSARPCGDGIHGLVNGGREDALHARHRRSPSGRSSATQPLLLGGE